MTVEQRKAIRRFFKVVEELQSLEIIRSSKFLGDIGEFLASDKFDLELSESQRQSHYDAIKNSAKIQIKFYNAKERTNIDVGDPNNYDQLIIVIGPSSKIREIEHKKDEFRIYKFYKSEVSTWEKDGGKSYFCAKKQLKNATKKYIIS